MAAAPAGAGDDATLVAVAEQVVARDAELAARLLRRAARAAERSGSWPRARGRASARGQRLGSRRTPAAGAPGGTRRTGAISRLRDLDDALTYTSNIAVGLLDAGATAEALALLDDA